MPWSALGWLLAKFLMSCCALPGIGEARAGALGRSCRAKLPWRLSSAAARSMASSSARGPQALSWTMFAWSACVGALAAWAFKQPWGAAAGILGGIAPAALLSRASGKAGAARARGRLWLGAVSSSELCLSMGPVAAGPRARPGKEGLHPGFRELASRLAALRPEGAPGRRARRRLLGMALACSGSERAARWLWSRRRDRRSMALWARDLGSEMGSSGEGWELCCGLMGLDAKAADAVGGAGEAGAVPMDAADIDESSLPLLWLGELRAQDAKLSGEGFQAELAMELARAWCQMPSKRWGWREGADTGFKRRLASALRARSAPWRSMLDAAPALIEAAEMRASLAAAPGPEPAPRRL